MYRIHHPNLSTGRYLCCPPKVYKVKDTEDTLTWAGFMSSLLKNDRPNIKPNTIIGVMPDKTVSTPMVKHAMNIGKCVTEFLNPFVTSPGDLRDL